MPNDTKPRPLTDSKAYTDFIKQRNHVLERLLFYYQGLINDEVEELKIRIEQVAVHLYHVSVHSDIKWEEALGGPFKIATDRTLAIVQRMRKTIYALSLVGEAEGIGRATGRKANVSLGQYHLNHAVQRHAPSGGAMDKRIALGFRRIMRNVIDRLESSVLNPQLQASYIIDDIDLAFPKIRTMRPVHKIPRPIKKLTEAKKPTSQSKSLVTGFIDDDTWNDLVQDYTDAEIPSRGPEDLTTVFGTAEPEERYSWEVEQEITQDFLQQVRTGQIDAANQNGIEEFMWIAIIDKKTDDCCEWRHGLTTSEIESALAGDHSGDDCDAIVPPAHFNCRCNIAPVTKEVMDEEPLDLGDFGEWLR